MEGRKSQHYAAITAQLRRIAFCVPGEVGELSRIPTADEFPLEIVKWSGEAGRKCSAC